MSIPPAFYGWYKSNYPTLEFNPEWLNACVEYLQSTDPSCSNGSSQSLIKQVETQLLCSDLSTSILQTSKTLLSNSRIFKTLIPANTATSEEKIVFKGGKKKGAVLLQVEKIQEVSYSSSSLLEIVKEKTEWNKLKAKGLDGNNNEGGGRDMRLDDENEEHNEIEEEEKKILTGRGGGGDKEPRFLRGSGKLLLSDGKNLVQAFELQKIQGLGLEEIKLGTKLLVFDVPFINGIMLLTPQNTIVKGFEIEEFNQFKLWSIENSLRQKLDLELLPKPDDQPQFQPQAQAQLSPSPPPPPATNQKPAPRRPEPRAGPSSNRSRARQQQEPPPPRNDDDEFDNDDNDMEGIDFDLLQAQAIIQKQSQSQSQSKTRTQTKPLSNSTAGKGKGKGKARAAAVINDEYGMEDFEEQVEEEEEEEEGWNVMNEIEQQQRSKTKSTTNGNSSKQKGIGIKVKNEPKSSGEKVERKGKQVEVLELDSDEDEDGQEQDQRPPPVKRSADGRGGGTVSRKVMVLEIDDSD